MVLLKFVEILRARRTGAARSKSAAMRWTGFFPFDGCGGRQQSGAAGRAGMMKKAGGTIAK